MPEERERGTGPAAAVEIVENEPIGMKRRKPGRRSPAMLIAENEGKMVTTVEQSQGEDGAAITTEHRRPGTVVMYKPVGKRYEPRVVAGSAIRVNLTNGWREFCPLCEDKHLDKNGQESTDPNLCAAQDPVAVRVCPVCQKRIYDNIRFSEQAEYDPTDLNVIKDDTSGDTTGASRTAISLNEHLWLRHRRQAEMMGTPLSPGVKAMIEEMKVT